MLWSEPFLTCTIWCSVDLMHDDVLRISFTTTPRFHVVAARFFRMSCWYSFQSLPSGKHLHFECEAWGELISKTSPCIISIETHLSPVYTEQTNPGRTRVRPVLKLAQVVFTRHFSKLTRVEPGLAVFTRQKLTRVSLYRVNRA